ncbi:MAG: histidinol-phosphate transaminase [Clostridiales bacterium]|nr:histidinol-phosphate transaminase [Clostridiales bacterium]
MAYQLSEKLKKMVSYEPISGDYAIRLDANESFLPVDEEIKAEFTQKLSEIPFNRYPDPLAAEVCRKFADYYGINADFVTAGNGSDELISVIIGAFLSEGDKLLTVMPDFSMYGFYADLTGVTVLTQEKDENLNIDVDAVIQTVQREKVNCVMFSNPCNPTGQGLPREEVRRLITSVDCLVVLDEAYMDFYTESLLTEAEQYDNLIILRTCSKALGLAAVRLGFAVANPTLTTVLRAAKSPYNVNSVTQAYGSVVLSHKEKEQAALAQILASREELYGALVGMQEKYHCFERVYPTVTNFVLVETSRAKELLRN